MYVVVVQKFTFAISSPDEFLFVYAKRLCYTHNNVFTSVCKVSNWIVHWSSYTWGSKSSAAQTSSGHLRSC